MFEKEYEASAHGAAAKVRFLEENPLGYVMVSLLGGAYLGFGVLLTYAIESYLGPQPSVHIIMGLSFGVALSLVIIAGAEMFTGDAFILYNGLRRKTVTAGDVVKLLVVCYLGNWLGALILSVIFYGTGLAACVIILRQQRPAEQQDKVLFINGEDLMKKGRSQNTLESTHAEELFDTYTGFADLEGRARVVDLAKEFGVAKQTISNIVCGHTWTKI